MVLWMWEDAMLCGLIPTYAVLVNSCEELVVVVLLLDRGSCHCDKTLVREGERGAMEKGKRERLVWVDG